MLAKLALRNIRRQTSSYIIYFITTAFTVALMFAANNILFADELWDYSAADVRIMIGILISIIVIVTLVVGFIISYATAYMLKKRKKELGTYMLLGIRRSKVITIFALENVIIGLISFIVGSMLGVGVFYVLNAMICAMVGNDLRPMNLVLGSIPMTLLQWVGIFVIAVVYSCGSIFKSNIGELINDKPHEKVPTKMPSVENVLAVVIFGAIIALSFFIVLTLNRMFDFTLDYREALVLLPLSTVALIVLVFLFYMCLRSLYLQRLAPKKPKPPAVQELPTEQKEIKPIVGREYKSRALKGSNLFHYRQLSSSINRNSAVMGIIAVLVSFAIISTMVIFSLRYVQIAQIDYPFDFMHRNSYTNAESSDYQSPEQIIDQAEQYVDITFSHTIVEYATVVDNHTLKLIALSDFNVVSSRLGERELSLNDNEYCGVGMRYTIFNDELEFYGNTYTYTSIEPNEYMQFDEMLSLFDSSYVVLPDSAFTPEATQANASSWLFVMNKNGHLPKEFYQSYISKRSVDFELDMINVQFSVLIVSAIFLGMTFMLMAMALLSLKVMSDADMDKRRFAILNMLGVDVRAQRRILLRQLFVFFAVPLFIPMLLSVPAAIASVLMSIAALGSVPTSVYGICIAVPIIYLAVYLFYFVATYYLSVQTCIKPMEKARLKLLVN